MPDEEQKRGIARLAPLIAPTIALSGLFTYATLIAGYNQFYGLLGIGLGEVNLSYANVLAESVGLVAVMTVIALALLAAANRAMLNSFPDEPATAPALFFSACFLLACLTIASYLHTNAEQAAIAAISGRPVRQLRAGPIVFFGIHAYPTDIVLLSGEKAIEPTLQGRLLYLGQSGGTLVLYNSSSRSAVRLPSSSVEVVAQSCDAAYAQDMSSPCRAAYDPMRDYESRIPFPECRLQWKTILRCDFRIMPIYFLNLPHVWYLPSLVEPVLSFADSKLPAD